MPISTHTHAGPGQFLGTDFYNRFASNRSGFDPASKAFYNGGDFKGVMKRLDYIQSLGATAVWLAPVGRWLHGIPGCVFHCYSCPLSSFACPVGVMANYAALLPAA